jgi:hypothetical protein
VGFAISLDYRITLANEAVLAKLARSSAEVMQYERETPRPGGGAFNKNGTSQ